MKSELKIFLKNYGEYEIDNEKSVAKVKVGGYARLLNFRENAKTLGVEILGENCYQNEFTVEVAL